MRIPGAPIHQLDCCDAQEFHISRQDFICFDKTPAIRETPEATAVMGKCRFCERTIVVKMIRATGTWVVESYPPS